MISKNNNNSLVPTTATTMIMGTNDVRNLTGMLKFARIRPGVIDTKTDNNCIKIQKRKI